MKKIISLLFLIIAIVVLTSYFIFLNPQKTNEIIDQPTLNSTTESPLNSECIIDDDCKLIYSNCDCVSVPVDNSNLLKNDPRVDFLEKERNKICKWNLCRGTNVTAVCEDGKCIRSDLKK